jgi:hypothetical protein
MSIPPSWVPNLADPILTAGKRVLAVEGPRDSQIYTTWLGKLAPAGTGAVNKVLVVPTRGKHDLINGLKWYRDEGGNPGDVFGLRDRDEWDAARITAEMVQLPQLRVNADRHCLESYFCDPDEIEAALLAHDAARFTPYLAKLRADLQAPLGDWADHWCLWTITNRLNVEMQGAKFPHLFHTQYKLPPDADIKKRLEDWAVIVEPSGVFNQFDTLRSATRSGPARDHFRSCIYAKIFFPLVVHQQVLRLLDPQDADEWMKDLAAWSPVVPPDIAAILQPLLV